MNWFINCITPEDIRKEYHNLCKVHHPDVGGDTATMQSINVAYSVAIKNAERRAHPDYTEDQEINQSRVNEQLRVIIERVIKLSGIKIEVCGLWIWITGNTYQHKDALKAAGFKWSKGKSAWYYAGIPSSNRRPFSLNKIRATYGSTRIEEREERTPRPQPAFIS